MEVGNKAYNINIVHYVYIGKKLGWAGSVLSSMAAEGADVPDELLADLLRVLHHPLVVHLLARLGDVGILQSGRVVFDIFLEVHF